MRNPIPDLLIKLKLGLIGNSVRYRNRMWCRAEVYSVEGNTLTVRLAGEELRKVDGGSDAICAGNSRER